MDREGKEFKLSSPKQVATIIYDIYGCPLIEVKGKTGRSTAEDFIVALQREDISGEAKCFLELLLEHRKVSKQLSTYVDKAIEQWMSSDGFVHANFNPTGTETGRLSSSSPNLQNIPRGPRFRGMFVSRFEDGIILDVDYSQIEARVAACLSKDEMLCETFRSGEDFHRKNAALIFNVPYDAVTDEQRQEAKGLASFGLLYGKAAWSLAQDLNISEEVAQTYVDRYFSAAPRLKQWIEAVKELVAQRGYVTTPFGRVRYFPQYSSSSAKEVAEVKRAAVNTIIQSTAADLVKRAAYLIIAELQRRGLETVVWNVVHDSIVFDVPRAELDEVKVLARELMEDMSRYSWAIIPFTVEFKENERRWK
ncbi:MAG: hypothetical protein DRO01_07065 [Thermoproteota archaeon]|nr:MAG: hypothetical protein DRO01_07065 [Candidatus Korarchaeota archaeon]